MLPSGPDDYMARLLAAHHAEDAFEPDDDMADAAGNAQETPPTAAAPAIDPEPILGLLGEAERLCGLDLPRLHAAAAA